MDIYERLKNGEPINTRESREFKEILWPETVRSRTLCQKINSLPPFDGEVRALVNELFEGRFPESSNISPPSRLTADTASRWASAYSSMKAWT
ncbi:hypothetical protein ABFY27_02315 [Akkermansia massiliensis]